MRGLPIGANFLRNELRGELSNQETSFGQRIAYFSHMR